MSHRILRRRSEHRHPGVNLPGAKRIWGKSFFDKEVLFCYNKSSVAFSRECLQFFHDNRVNLWYD